MFRRYAFFFGLNIVIVLTISIILRITGLDNYISSEGMNYPVMMMNCLVWGMVGAFISLLLSKTILKRQMRVETITESGPYQKLYGMVRRLSERAGLPKVPEVGIYHSPEINAFATGPSKSNSLVAVSTGLLERMNDEEVEGVIGHEISHIANGDMVTMTLLQGVINAFVMFLARAIAFLIDQAMRSDDDDGEGFAGIAYFIIVIVLQIFFGIFGSIIVNWFSRHREFKADAASGRIVGKDKMIKALQALQLNYQALEQAKNPSEVNCMQISSKKGFSAFFSTHPALEDRIEALQRSSY